MRGAPVQRKAEWGHRLRFSSEAVLEQFCARHCGNMSGMMLPSSVHGSGAEEERHPAALPIRHSHIAWALSPVSPGTGFMPPCEKPCSLNAEAGILLTCAPGLTALVLSEMTAGKLTWQSGFCSVESQTSK